MAERGNLPSVEEMFAQAPKGAPDLDPYPNLLPGREERFRSFLVKFGDSHPQELSDIMSTPSKYSPIGGIRADLIPGVGYAVLVRYMEGGLVSEAEIEKWKLEKKAAEEARVQEWRKMQKKFKGRGGIPDVEDMEGMLTEAEKKGRSDEARAKATSYSDDLESPLTADIPAAGSEAP